VNETHVLLGDGVNLDTVAELLLNEIGAAVHLQKREVTAAFWKPIDLLVCGLVGIQDQHHVLFLAGLPDEGERVVPMAFLLILVEEEHDHVVKGLEEFLSLIDCSCLEVLTPFEL
jgi:hypothetical protein